MTMSLNRLRREGEAFMEEIKYAGILGEESLELAREAFLSAPDDTEERRSARALLDWQVESQSSRQLAAQDEREIEWEGTAVVNVSDTRQLQFQAECFT